MNTKRKPKGFQVWQVYVPYLWYVFVLHFATYLLKVNVGKDVFAYDAKIRIIPMV